MLRKFIPFALVLLLSGCGSYYNFNGVPLRGEEEQTGLSSGSKPPNFATMSLKGIQKYCTKNPATCVGLGLGVVVGGVFFVQQRNDAKNDEPAGIGCPPNC